MKGTAIGLLVLGAYWVVEGMKAIRQDDMNGIISLVLGIALLPLAKYVWNKNLTGMK